MGRIQSKDRILSGKRTPSLNRRPVGFVNDNKIHIVLDTNIIIYALESLKKGSQKSSKIELDSLQIIRLIENEKITIAINLKLYEEYQRVGARILSEGRANPADFSYIMEILNKNLVAVRLMVDPRRVSPHKNDDILFDGLAAEYLISNNMKDVNPRFLTEKSTYKKTLLPSEFLNEIKNFG